MTVYPERLVTRVTSPAVEPLTLAEAKLFLRVDGSDEDAFIEELIVAARIVAEEYLNRSLIDQLWKLSYNDETPCRVMLPRGPVSALNSVIVKDRTGAAQSISSSTYYLNAARNLIEFDAAPLAFLIEITYTAGYGADATYVPQPIRKGMLIHLASLYEARGDTEILIPAQALSLYAAFREVRM